MFLSYIDSLDTTQNGSNLSGMFYLTKCTVYMLEVLTALSQSFEEGGFLILSYLSKESKSSSTEKPAQIHEVDAFGDLH